MLKAGLIGLALVAGCALALGGLYTIGLAARPWPDPADLGLFAACLAVFAGATLAIARLTRLSLPLGALVVAALLAFAAGAWTALVFVPVFVLSSMALGRQLAERWAGAGFAGDLLLDFLLGAGTFATLLGLLAHLPVAWPAVYAALLLLPFAPRPRLVLELAHGLLGELRTWAAPRAGQPELVALCALALLYFGVAFLPELGHDALAMHLYVPNYVDARREWSFDPALYAWALMPMLGDWLYTLLYVLAGETGARLVNVSFILALAVFTWRFARWVGAGERPALWAALLYLSMPLTFGEGSSLFIDSIWAAYLLAAFWWLLQAAPGNQRQALVLGGLFLGFALQAKLGTTTFLAMFLLCLAWAARQAPGLLRGANVLRLLLPLLALGCVPYLTAWLIAGNPVFPFFNGIFRSPYYPPQDFASSFPGYLSWDLPWLLTFTSDRFMDGSVGTPGFQWLMLLPAALVAACLDRNGRALLLLAAGLGSIAITFQAQSYVRYVFPVLPPLIAALAPLLQRGDASFLRPLALGVAGLCLAANLVFFSASTWGYRELAPAAIFDDAARAGFIAGYVPERGLAPLINSLNPAGMPVAFLALAPAVADVDADVLFSSWYNQAFLQRMQDAVGDAGAIARVLRDYGAQLVVLDENLPFGDFKDKVHMIGETLATRGSYTLLRVLPDYRFGEELLENPALAGGTGWELQGAARYDAAAQAFVVSAPAPASQSVPIRGNREYRLQLRESCVEPGVQGRLQVNWHDEAGEYLSSSLSVFTCSEGPAGRELLVQSPADASWAAVFLTSHEDRPIRIHSVSLR